MIFSSAVWRQLCNRNKIFKISPRLKHNVCEKILQIGGRLCQMDRFQCFGNNCCAQKCDNRFFFDSVNQIFYPLGLAEKIVIYYKPVPIHATWAIPFGDDLGKIVTIFFYRLLTCRLFSQTYSTAELHTHFSVVSTKATVS